MQKMEPRDSFTFWLLGWTKVIDGLVHIFSLGYFRSNLTLNLASRRIKMILRRRDERRRSEKNQKERLR